MCDTTRSSPRAARAPDDNPLAPDARDPLLPPGTPVCLMFGPPMTGAGGATVLRGEALGYAVRGGGYLDIEIAAIQTWLHSDAPYRLETLPPRLTTYVRVGIVRSLAHTVELLRADPSWRTPPEVRSLLPAIEIYYRRCPWCRDRLLHAAPYCGSCGRRVAIGWVFSGPMRRDPGSCAGCWRLKDRGDGRFCAACGYDGRSTEHTRALIGREVVVRLRDGRRKPALAQGGVVGARVERVRPGDSGVRLVLDLWHLSFDGADLEDLFTARVAVSVPTVRLGDPVGPWLAGVPPYAQEVKRGCPRCGGAAVLTRYCGACGARVRISPHPSAARAHNPGPDAVRHTCGTLVLPGPDRHCTGCGRSVRLLDGLEDKMSRIL
jgi:hypothetical protein